MLLLLLAGSPVILTATLTEAVSSCPSDAPRKKRARLQASATPRACPRVRQVKITERAAGHVGAINWHAVRLYRLSRRLWLGERRAAALLVAAVNRVLTGVEIAPQAAFGEGLVIMHGCGIVVHPRVRVGRDCTLYQGVTLGSTSVDGDPPTLEHGVTVFPGAKVLGAVTVGDGATIGANAVVLCDVPADATAVGVPARIMPRQRRVG